MSEPTYTGLDLSTKPARLVYQCLLRLEIGDTREEMDENCLCLRGYSPTFDLVPAPEATK